MRFSWHNAKNVTRDPASVAADFSVQDYATLVAHPSPFWKFPEEFLCLVRLSCHYTLDEETYLLFLDKDEEDMDIFAFIHTLDPTKVKVVERERKEDEPRLLETTVSRTVPLLPVALDRGESELDASVDKLFDEGGSGTQTEQGDSAGGGGEQGINIQPVTETIDAVAEDVISLQPRRLEKKKTIVSYAGGPSHPPKKLREDHRTLSGGEPIPTIPFVTSSISATPKREDEGHTNSVTGRNLRTISAPQRFVISSDSSYHSGANIAKADVDSFLRPSVQTDPAMVGLTDLTGSDFLVGGIHTIINPDPNLQNTYLFTEFNVGAGRQMYLSVEVRMRAEYNIREKRRLKSVVEEKNQLLKARDEEIKNLKAHLLLKESEAAEDIRLRTEAFELETEEKSLRDEVTDLKAVVVSKERELTDFTAYLTSIKSQNDNLVDQDAQLKVVNDKFEKLYTDFVKMTLHLEERFYPHLLTTIAGRRWPLTHGMELVVAKSYFDRCAAHNPSAEVDYVFALQHLHGVNFSLLAELKSNKDDSIEALMNILRLEEHLAERLGLNKLQPHADQLMVPIHHSPDTTVVGCLYSLGRAFFWCSITGTKSTSDTITATADTTAALYVTFASASIVDLISIDDYKDTGMDDQPAATGNVADVNVNPFPNVEDAEMNIS
nr:transposase (putative), gypsy type [Tanacetum cinerariifolium]